MALRFLDESLEKVRNKEWDGKAYEVLHVTGTIIEGLGKSGVPLIDMLELALKLGSNVLDPIPQMSELEKEIEVIEKIIEDNPVPCETFGCSHRLGMKFDKKLHCASVESALS